jgi:GxxExxY protein
MQLLHSDICSTILKAFYSIANALPFGLDKSFYTNALAIELQILGLKTEADKPQTVFYKKQKIGELNIDIVVDNVVPIKVDNQKGFIENEQMERAKNYLKLTDFEVLLLLNFGIEADHKRLFLTSDFKKRS